MTSDLPISAPNNKTKTYVIGGLVGLAVGLLAAYFYARVSDEHGVEPGRISSMDALKLAVALLSIIRQITDMGAGNGKK